MRFLLAFLALIALLASSPIHAQTAASGSDGAITSGAAPTSAPAPAVSPASKVIVWVNTETGVYHMPGTRWYGNTKHGKYMSEDDAIKEGDREAKNGQ